MIIREFPNAQYDFLRFQIGRQEKKQMQVPHYVGRLLLSIYPGPETAYFRLLGFGSTLKAAEEMAKCAS